MGWSGAAGLSCRAAPRRRPCTRRGGRPSPAAGFLGKLLLRGAGRGGGRGGRGWGRHTLQHPELGGFPEPGRCRSLAWAPGPAAEMGSRQVAEAPTSATLLATRPQRLEG